MSQDPPSELDPVVGLVVRLLVGRAARRARLSRHDQEDLEQDMLLHWWQRRGRFDPDRGGQDAFVTVMIRNAIANALRDRLARCRNPRRLRPLPDADDASLVDVRRSNNPCDPSDLAELRLDLANTLEQASAAERDLAVRLQERAPATVARELGISRAALAKAARRLLARFEKASLRDYL